MGTPGRPLDERTRQRLIQMGQQGVDASEAARAMQVSGATARKIFRENPVDKNRRIDLIGN
jgi:DNA invertase Pin-like site-specific DNA recombinase